VLHSKAMLIVFVVAKVLVFNATFNNI